MKKIFLPLLMVLTVSALVSNCGKGGGSGPDSCSSEAALSVTTSPANGATELPSPGPSFPLKVTVGSTLPPSGVSIQVKVKQDGSSTYFFNQTYNATAAVTDITITGTPSTVVCVVEVTVTSKTCNTNKWSGSYRYSMK